MEISQCGDAGCQWGWYLWAECGSGELVLSLPLAIECIESMQAYLAEPLLVLEWESSIPEVDTWMVEWLPETAEAKLSALSWESVSQATNWTIEQGSRHQASSWSHLNPLLSSF